MKYRVVVKRTGVVEINAGSAEEAMRAAENLAEDTIAWKEKKRSVFAELLSLFDEKDK